MKKQGHFEPPPGLQRRVFLRRALWVGLAGAGGALLYQGTGYALPEGLSFEDLRLLSTREAAVLAAVSGRVLAGVEAPDATDATAEVVVWVDGYLARQSRWVRREVRALLHAFEQSPPLLAGRLSRFTRLDPEGQDAVLRGWSISRFAVCRQGFAALKGMVLMGAYRRASFLRAIGYDGPSRA